MSGDGNEQFALGSERAALDNFLDAQREGLIRKIQGLDDSAARQVPTASSLSLLGLVKHATTWERRWFQVVLSGRESGEEWPTVRGRNEATFLVGEQDTVDDWSRSTGSRSSSPALSRLPWISTAGVRVRISSTATCGTCCST